MVTTRWWWVRHAPVTVNRGCVYGQTDLPCETDDAPAFARLAQTLPREAAWVVTNLQRTRQTAAAIQAAGLPAGDALVEPDLAEQHFGDWQGQTYAGLAATRAEEYHRFWLAPATERAPGGESFVDLMTRAAGAIGRLTERFAGRDIIAVAHGGTIRAALGLALDLPPETALAFAIDNLSVTRLDHIGGAEAGRGHGWRIAAVNVALR